MRVMQVHARVAKLLAREVDDNEQVRAQYDELPYHRMMNDGKGLEGQQSGETYDHDPLSPGLSAQQQPCLQGAGGAIQPRQYRPANDDAVRQMLLDPPSRSRERQSALSQLPGEQLQGSKSRARRQGQP